MSNQIVIFRDGYLMYRRKEGHLDHKSYDWISFDEIPWC